jgi:hypothetical protein
MAEKKQKTQSVYDTRGILYLGDDFDIPDCVGWRPSDTRKLADLIIPAPLTVEQMNGRGIETRHTDAGDLANPSPELVQWAKQAAQERRKGRSRIQ